MKKAFKIGIAVSAWVIIGLVTIPVLIKSCSKDAKLEKQEREQAQFDGLLLNDDLTIVSEGNGKVSIKNVVTGKTSIKDVKLDWSSSQLNDSLAVFCAEGKRGYYNVYTGCISIEPKYRRAWFFSEGLAAVLRNGKIGFLDRKGNVAIPFSYSYYGNPLSEFLFKNGHCVVADSTGKCGVINKLGEWVIKPEYDMVKAYPEYAVVTKAGIRMQVDYNGEVINKYLLDRVSRLTYTVQERFENREGEIEYVNKTIDTKFFEYTCGGRCGLMNAHGKRVTEPLYLRIYPINSEMFSATLIDGYSEVILNTKGEVI